MIDLHDFKKFGKLWGERLFIMVVLLYGKISWKKFIKIVTLQLIIIIVMILKGPINQTFFEQLNH